MNRTPRRLWSAIGPGFIGLTLSVHVLTAQETQPSPSSGAQTAPEVTTIHPWSKFGVGSWKEVRVHHQSLSEDGNVVSSSVTRTRTTLVENSAAGYALRIEVEVEVAGRRLPVDPKVIRQGLHGENSNQTAHVQSLGAADVTIDGQKYPVEVRRVTIQGDELNRVSLIHYTDRISPYVLKRETKGRDPSGMKPGYESMVEVIGVDMPFRVLNETKLVSQVKTTHRQANGSTSVTVEFYCDEVPGGVVANSVKELDAQGRVIARSTLELTNSEVVPSTDLSETVPTSRRRLFRHGRNR